MTLPLIDLTHLSCQIGQHYLLKDITWQLYPQKHTVIFGQNGSGKTTLLSAILNYVPITEGEAKIFACSIDKQNIFTLRQKIGFVSSSFFDKYFHEESVQDIILSGLTGTFSKGYQTNSTALKRASSLLKTFDLLGHADYPYQLLSKGQQQQVLIARALIADRIS